MELVGVYYANPAVPPSLEGDADGLRALASAASSRGEVAFTPLADERATGRDISGRAALRVVRFHPSRLSLVVRDADVLVVTATPSRLRGLAHLIEWLVNALAAEPREHFGFGHPRDVPRWHPASQEVIVGGLPQPDGSWSSN
jgi:hypothetical protein